MKNIYFAGIFQYENGRNLAAMVTIPADVNLLSEIKEMKDCKSLNFCETKKEARETVNLWNDCFKSKGTYYFS